MKRAVIFFAAAAAIMAAEGAVLARAWHITYGHGVYCVIGVASTVGCDAGPRDAAGRAAEVAVILTCVPLLAAVFAWVTGRHAGRHAAATVKQHLEGTEQRIAEAADRRHDAMKAQLAAHCADIKQHVSAVAAPASGGAGSSPPAVSRKLQRPKGM